MRKTNFYEVAGHVFCVEAEDYIFEYADNYSFFLIEEKSSPLFKLEVKSEKFLQCYQEELSQEEEGQKIICGHTNDGKSVYEFILGGIKTGVLVCGENFVENVLYINKGYEKFSLDNALMIIFALASASKSTLLFHSSTIEKDGKGYMFLGKSGTGKSTHSRLWLKNIPQTELLNDDNPAVRIFNGNTVKVFGTPWSGKTPCYKNKSCELRSIVVLKQAPYNKITPLSGIFAYAAVVPGVSGKRWVKTIADSLHESENSLIQLVKVFQLECLPDDEASVLCYNTIK